jgi:hypothetical protein
MKMALLFERCDDDTSRPRYGLIDDEELLRHGRSIFLCTDGRRLIAGSNDVVLLQLKHAEMASSPG